MRKAVAALEKRMENVKQRRGEVISDETRREVAAILASIEAGESEPMTHEEAVDFMQMIEAKVAQSAPVPHGA